MGYQMDRVERVNLGEVEEGNSIQLTGTVDGKPVTLGVDVFKKTDEHLFAIGMAIQQTDGGQPTVDMDLSERFFRLPLQGVIEPGDISIDSVTAPLGVAGEVDGIPDEAWAPLHVGCVALELFHLVAE